LRRIPDGHHGARAGGLTSLDDRFTCSDGSRLSGSPTLRDMTDPILQAAIQIVDESFAAMREAIAGTPPDALNSALADGANSMAVLVTHAMHSTRWWLSAATHAPMPDRDRPSEFKATAPSVDELMGFFDGMAADCRALLRSESSFDAGAVREIGDGEPVTAAWALLHALEHLGEHVGHAQLTVQLSNERGV